MKNIRIAILDDHQIIIDGLKLLLDNMPHLQVVLECNNGYKLIERLKEDDYKLDILLLDLMMPVVSGFETAQLFKQHFPNIKLIVLSMNTETKIIYDLIETADIKGFLPKSVSKNELIEAIERVYDDKNFFSDEVLIELAKFKNTKKEKEDLLLSPREIEIIKLISKGYTNKQIGNILFISEQTVATHRKNIFRKTNTHNVGSLLDLANKLNLLS